MKSLVPFRKYKRDVTLYVWLHYLKANHQNEINRKMNDSLSPHSVSVSTNRRHKLLLYYKGGGLLVNLLCVSRYRLPKIPNTLAWWHSHRHRRIQGGGWRKADFGTLTRFHTRSNLWRQLGSWPENAILSNNEIPFVIPFAPNTSSGGWSVVPPPHHHHRHP